MAPLCTPAERFLREGSSHPIPGTSTVCRTVNVQVAGQVGNGFSDMIQCGAKPWASRGGEAAIREARLDKPVYFSKQDRDRGFPVW